MRKSSAMPIGLKFKQALYVRFKARHAVSKKEIRYSRIFIIRYTIYMESIKATITIYVFRLPVQLLWR